MIARVTAVKESREGSELEVAVAAGATELALTDPEEMDWEGGQLLIGSEVKTYTVDPDTEVVELVSGLANAYEDGEGVYQYPITREREAYLQGEDQREELVARVPHALYDRLPVGIRESVTDAEVVQAELDGGELVVSDVVGRRPMADVGYLEGVRINAGTVDLDTTSSPMMISDPIEHGLGVQPFVVANAQYDAGKGTSRLVCTIGGRSTATFQVRVRTVDGSNLGAPAGLAYIRVNWIAVAVDFVVGLPDEEGGFEEVDAGGTIDTD